MSTAAVHDHPVFTRVYGVVAGLVERGPVGRTRSSLLAGATGRLLIVGLGPGLDLDHVPTAVTEVITVEPSMSMLDASASRRRALEARGVPVRVLAATAEHLPLPDDSVDTVLSAFVLCSVADVAAAARSMRRVLRPGGRLLVLEHVRGGDRSPYTAVQRLVEPAWGALAGGCSLVRDPRAALAYAGFATGDLGYRWMPNFPLCARHLVGSVAAGPPGQAHGGQEARG